MSRPGCRGSPMPNLWSTSRLRLASTPIPLYMPEEDAWDSDAADWYAAAEDVLSAWAWELID